MKKLMFGIASLCAAVAMGVESANVVGYQEKELGAGEFSMTTPTFKAISGDYKISDIVVSGEVGGYGSEFCQKLNSDGSWGQDYYYLTEANTGMPDGWYKDSAASEPVTDEDTVKEGEALSFSVESSFKMIFSGQVTKSEPAVEIPDGGFVMAGNPTPVEVKISDLVVVGDVGGYGNEFGQKLNSDGSWGQDYYYLTEANTGMPDGWYKDSAASEPVTDEDVLAPGEALSISAEAGFTLKFPSAL